MASIMRKTPSTKKIKWGKNIMQAWLMLSLNKHITLSSKKFSDSCRKQSTKDNIENELFLSPFTSPFPELRGLVTAEFSACADTNWNMRTR